MNLVKRTVKVIFAFLVIGLSVSLLWLSEHYVNPILMYHVVDYAKKPEPNWVSPELFDYQMAYLKNHQFHVVPLETIITAIRNNDYLPRRTVAITFDDGYEDNYTKAFPILKKYQFPATIFLVADWVDRPGFLTTEEIREMKAHGISFGSHSKTHPYLPSVPKDKISSEILGSKQSLEEKLGFAVETFSYPFGGYDQSVANAVEAAGYLGATTTNRGYDRYNRHAFELKRVRLSDKDNKDYILWMKFLGYYNLTRELKDPDKPAGYEGESAKSYE